MYRSILIAVDLANTTNIDSLVEHASAHASSDAKIVLLNVVEDIPSWAQVELPRGIQDKSVQSAVGSLNALAASIKLDVGAEVRVGHPYKTILEVSKEMGSELIIVASHQPDLQDYFLGSTAAKVVRHATCSVLVVR